MCTGTATAKDILLALSGVPQKGRGTSVPTILEMVESIVLYNSAKNVSLHFLLFLCYYTGNEISTFW
jgi:hypothetical protein